MVEPPREEAKTQLRASVKPCARTKPLPPHAVVLHNDPVNGFGHVITTLRKVFGYGEGKAFLLTLRAHLTGKSVVWTGSLEVAELKAEQVRGCGPDPRMLHRGAARLRVSVEPLPG